MAYGSDLMIETLADLGIEHVVINPGASLSGLHDSLDGSERIQSFLTLHENVAMSASDGYSRVTGKPMGVFLHNLVGLQSGAMGVFNSWVNQSPVMILGGAGPADWATRRPWIDWVHAGKLQSQVVRDSVKWHDQPSSLAAVTASLARGYRVATHSPCGPTYVAVDVSLQEETLTGKVRSTNAGLQAGGLLPPNETIARIAAALSSATFPVVVVDLVSTSHSAFEAVAALAETLNAAIVDLGARHNLPPSHWADCTFAREEVLSRADVVLVLGARDLHYAIGRFGHRDQPVELLVNPGAKVVDVSSRALLSGTLVDYASPESNAECVTADPAEFISALIPVLNVTTDVAARRQLLAQLRTEHRPDLEKVAAEAPDDDGVSLYDVSDSTKVAVGDSRYVIANGELRGWVRAVWDLGRHNAHLGRNLGAGLGYGIGASIGAAIALRDDEPDTIVVNFQNDGDFLYTPSGLWSAARYKLPILTVMVNNRMYGQDKRHAARLASIRGHEPGYLPDGLAITEPSIDFAAMAAAQGVRSWGPCATRDELRRATREAADYIRATGLPALVDAHVTHNEHRLVTI